MAARGGVIPPTPNPWVYHSGPDNEGLSLRVSFAWDPITRVLVSITSVRDPGCDFSKVFVGLGAGNSPNTTTRTWDVPEGTFVVPAATLTLLAQRGLSTIDHLLTTQITAG